MAPRITDRQRRFAEAYLETGDAALAAKRAGLAGSPAGLLRRPGVRLALEEAARQREEGSVASAGEVLRYLTGVMRGEADAEGKGGASTPRMKAAELLGKRLGVFNEVSTEAPRTPVILDDLVAGGGDAAGQDDPGGG